MIFSYPELTQFFRHIQEVAPIRSLSQWDRRERAVLLRHEDHLDVGAAHRICMLEAEVEARSSVLFLTSCDTYNVLSARSRRLIREIADLGFDVGLHFDPTLYAGDNAEALAPYVAQEAGLIADVTGRPVRTISLHNPSLHGLYPVFEGYINAYEPPYFDPRFYLSDSCMDFRGKQPDDVLGWLALDRVQVLLHPLHFGDEATSYAGILRRYIDAVEREIDRAFSEQNKTYRAEREARQRAAEA